MIIKIQRWWMYWITYKNYQHRKKKQVVTPEKRELLYTVKKVLDKGCCGPRTYTVQLWKNHWRNDEDQLLPFHYKLLGTEDKRSRFAKHKEEQEEYEQAIENENKGTDVREKVTLYEGVRLPHDMVWFSYYMRLAVEIELSPENCTISVLELLRLKMKFKKEITMIHNHRPAPYKRETPIGCILMHQFVPKMN